MQPAPHRPRLSAVHIVLCVVLAALAVETAPTPRPDGPAVVSIDELPWPAAPAPIVEPVSDRGTERALLVEWL